MEPLAEKVYLTVDEAAEKMQISPFQVRRMLTGGRLPGIKNRKKLRAWTWLIPAESLKYLMDTDPRRIEENRGKLKPSGNADSAIGGPGPSGQREEPKEMKAKFYDAEDVLIHVMTISTATDTFPLKIRTRRPYSGGLISQCEEIPCKLIRRDEDGTAIYKASGEKA